LAAIPAGRRSKWVTLAVWVALVAVFGPLGSKLGDRTSDEFALPDGSQSAQVSHLLKTRFPGGERAPALLVYRRAGGLTAADRATIRADAAAAEKLPLVGRPQPIVTSPKGDIAFLVLPLAHGSTTQTKRTIERLRALRARAPALEVHLTGTPALLNDIGDAIKQAGSTLLIGTGLLVLVLLILIYRSPLLPLIPLVVVGLSYAVATGIVDLLARSGVSISGTSTSLLLVLMFGVGTDYCLLLAGRYTPLLRTHEDRHAALANALTKAAPAIAASGVTVILALLALLASTLSLNRTLGPVNAIGIAVVVVASLTLLPALLAIAGRAAFWPRSARVQFDPAAQAGTEERPALWVRFARRVLARPVAALAGSIVLLGVFALGLLAYRTNADVLGQFRHGTDGTRGYEVMRSEFPPGTLAPTTAMVLRRGAPVTPRDLRIVRSRLLSVPGVRSVSPVEQRSADGRAVTVAVVFGDDPYGDRALERVAELRDRVRTLEPGVQVLLGDGSANRLDFQNAAGRDFKVIVPLVLAVILLTLIGLLRALVAPLYLLATVVLSFLGTLGVAVLLFRIVLGERSFDPELPVFAFIFLVALGSDYNIFLMSRIREEAATATTREAALRAVAATGPVITSAGLILAGTFAVLTVLPITILVEVGIAVALGVLLDTFLVRTLTVPALASLVGEASWWPLRAPRGASPIRGN
jgi:RND superfamily putative drug exporter